MKTRLFLLAAATTIGFAACQNQKPESGYTQQQLDSIVQYKADSAANALKMVNDSITNKMAADSVAKADSIAAAKSKVTTKTTVSKKTVIHKKGTPPVIVPIVKAPIVRTPAQIDADKKAARFGDAAAKARLAEDAATKKAARFGDKNAQEKVQQTDAQKKADRFNK